MHRKAKAHDYATFQRLVAIVLRLEEAGIRWQVYNHYNIIKFKAVVKKKTQDGVLRLLEPLPPCPRIIPAPGGGT